MYCLLYILTGSAFYWLSYRLAPQTEDQPMTHPARGEAEVILLYPEQRGLRVA